MGFDEDLPRRLVGLADVVADALQMIGKVDDGHRFAGAAVVGLVGFDEPAFTGGGEQALNGLIDVDGGGEIELEHGDAPSFGAWRQEGRGFQRCNEDHVVLNGPGMTGGREEGIEDGLPRLIVERRGDYGVVRPGENNVQLLRLGNHRHHLAQRSLANHERDAAVVFLHEDLFGVDIAGGEEHASRRGWQPLA
jgi:hypothetical protein